MASGFDDPFFRQMTLAPLQSQMTLVPLQRKNQTVMDKLLNRDQSLMTKFNQNFGRDMDLIAPSMPSMDDEMKRFATDMDIFRKTNMYSLMPGNSNRSHDLVSLQHPNHIITEGGEQKFRIRLDVSKFRPEEIEIKAKDNHLLVHAKHCEESQGSKSFSEYKQQYLLPTSVDPMVLASNLSDDGVLTIEAPVNKALGAPDTKIPIKNS